MIEVKAMVKNKVKMEIKVGPLRGDLGDTPTLTLISVLRCTPDAPPLAAPSEASSVALIDPEPSKANI